MNEKILDDAFHQSNRFNRKKLLEGETILWEGGQSLEYRSTLFEGNKISKGIFILGVGSLIISAILYFWEIRFFRVYFTPLAISICPLLIIFITLELENYKKKIDAHYVISNYRIIIIENNSIINSIPYWDIEFVSKKDEGGGINSIVLSIRPEKLELYESSEHPSWTGIILKLIENATMVNQLIQKELNRHKEFRKHER